MKLAKTVLLVDDAQLQIQLLTNCLVNAGYQILSAMTVGDALSIAISKLPDLIITDVMMDKQNGFALCRSLKKNLNTKSIPIIICSAKSAAIDRQWGLEQGANEYITKPFEEEKLVKVVDSLTSLA